MNTPATGAPDTFNATQERILLTGATGFLGGAVAARMIAEGQASALCFLVRADNSAQGLQRLRDNLRQHGVDERQGLALSEAQIICGDFLDTAWLARETPRLMQIDRVINCAAVASFSKNPNIWPVNVEGTFAFAQVLSRSTRLKRFLHVGTAMCCGPQRESPISESWEFPEAAQQLVDYTASKAEIERRLREALPALPLGGSAAVHRGRPSQPRLPGVGQHLLGVPHGFRPGKLYLWPGRTDRRDPGGLLRRGADRPSSQAAPGP